MYTEREREKVGGKGRREERRQGEDLYTFYMSQQLADCAVLLDCDLPHSFCDFPELDLEWGYFI